MTTRRRPRINPPAPARAAVCKRPNCPRLVWAHELCAGHQPSPATEPVAED